MTVTVGFVTVIVGRSGNLKLALGVFCYPPLDTRKLWQALSGSLPSFSHSGVAGWIWPDIGAQGIQLDTARPAGVYPTAQALVNQAGRVTFQ